MPLAVINVCALLILQVQQVLEKLNLVQYKPAFERKSITGADLAECKEQILREELGVSSKLDIIRLMKLIQGCPSAWKLLEKKSS